MLPGNRLLVLGRKTSTYKCAGNESSFSGSTSPPSSDRQARCSAEYRQLHCSWGTHSEQLSLVAIEMWNYMINRIFLFLQFMLQGHKVGRQGVKDVQRLSGMDAEPYNFQYDSTKGRASNFRLDCIKSKQTVEPLCQLKLERGAVASDAFNLKWDFKRCICFPHSV